MEAVGNPTDSPHGSGDAAEPDSAQMPEHEPDEDHNLRQAAQDQKIQKILLDAHRRDDEADIRDIESDKRAEAADLEAFLDTSETYSGHGERRAAALDRSHAKSDRQSSADDRAELTKHKDNPDTE
ncbi:hypothetical protein [Cryobacterium sp. N22]|uniref:hypothetical protein n=1 Tax=Cryobacterium sp. N22 TaxID=2048290 RepID=UPI00130487DF|nr:hypothetical protein [Cryobacterium sp. N22]